MQPQANEAPDVSRFGSPMFYFSNDANNRITFLSDAVEDVLGFRANEQIGRSFMDYLAQDHVANAAVKKQHEERFRTTVSQNCVRAVRDSNGGERILAVQTYGDRDSNGNVIRSRGCARDVTAWFHQCETLRRSHDKLSERRSRLSHRDQTVLQMITNGYLNKQIAKKLDVSTRTVEGARRRILDSLEIDNISVAIAIDAKHTLLAGLLGSIEHPALDRRKQGKPKVEAGAEGVHGLQPSHCKHDYVFTKTT